MIRLALICLPFLAMACASAPEREAIDYSEMQALEAPLNWPGRDNHCGHFQSGYDESWDSFDAIGLADRFPNWRSGLPLEISEQTFWREFVSGCQAQYFAIRSHDPLEFWLMCDGSTPQISAYRTETDTFTDSRIMITACDRNIGRSRDPSNQLAEIALPLQEMTSENAEEPVSNQFAGAPNVNGLAWPWLGRDDNCEGNSIAPGWQEGLPAELNLTTVESVFRIDSADHSFACGRTAFAAANHDQTRFWIACAGNPIQVVQIETPSFTTIDERFLVAACHPSREALIDRNQLRNNTQERSD